MQQQQQQHKTQPLHWQLAYRVTVLLGTWLVPELVETILEYTCDDVLSEYLLINFDAQLGFHNGRSIDIKARTWAIDRLQAARDIAKRLISCETMEDPICWEVELLMDLCMACDMTDDDDRDNVYDAATLLRCREHLRIFKSTVDSTGATSGAYLLDAFSEMRRDPSFIGWEIVENSKLVDFMGNLPETVVQDDSSYQPRRKIPVRRSARIASIKPTPHV